MEIRPDKCQLFAFKKVIIQFKQFDPKIYVTKTFVKHPEENVKYPEENKYPKVFGTFAAGST